MNDVVSRPIDVDSLFGRVHTWDVLLACLLHLLWFPDLTLSHLTLDGLLQSFKSHFHVLAIDGLLKCGRLPTSDINKGLEDALTYIRPVDVLDVPYWQHASRQSTARYTVI